MQSLLILIEDPGLCSGRMWLCVVHVSLRQHLRMWLQVRASAAWNKVLWDWDQQCLWSLVLPHELPLG